MSLQSGSQDKDLTVYPSSIIKGYIFSIDTCCVISISQQTEKAQIRLCYEQYDLGHSFLHVYSSWLETTLLLPLVMYYHNSAAILLLTASLIHHLNETMISINTVCYLWCAKKIDTSMLISYLYDKNQHMRFSYLLLWWAAKNQTSLCICVFLLEVCCLDT